MPPVNTPVLTELQPLDEIADETLGELISLDQPPSTDFDNPFNDNDSLGVFGNGVNAFAAEHINHNIAEYDSIEVETTAEEFIAQSINQDFAEFRVVQLFKRVV